MTRTLAQTETRKRKNGTRWKILLERKPEDLWIGAFWSTTTGPTGRWAVLDLWVCIVPTLPVHLFFSRPPVGAEVDPR